MGRKICENIERNYFREQRSKVYSFFRATTERKKNNKKKKILELNGLGAKTDIFDAHANRPRLRTIIFSLEQRFFKLCFQSLPMR